VRWTAFPLHPETPQEGQRLEDLFAGRPINIPEMLTHLKRTADQLGLPFGDRRMTFNSRRAQEVGKWAEECGRGGAFHTAAFKAYFAEGLNLADIPVLMDIARSVDLDPDQVPAILNDQRFKAAVDQDWQRSRAMGITAVPTFVMNARHLVGAQSDQELARFVQAGTTQ
jgi:predicted DsbA family dithiol-disulfide isomerase